MPKVIDVVEYPSDGIAIVEDTQGKFLVNAKTPEMTPLYNNDVLEAWFGSRSPCALLQGRDAMLT